MDRGRFPDLPLDVQDRWLRNSDPALWVCQREVADDPTGEVDLRDLLERVQDVCEEDGIEDPTDPRDVGGAMRRAHPRVKVERTGGRGDRRTVYHGVAWVTQQAGGPATAVPPSGPDGKTAPGATGVFITKETRETGKNEGSTEQERVADPPMAPGGDFTPGSPGATPAPNDQGGPVGNGASRETARPPEVATDGPSSEGDRRLDLIRRTTEGAIARAKSDAHRALGRARSTKLRRHRDDSLDLGPVLRTLQDQGHADGAIWGAVEVLWAGGYLELRATNSHPRNWYYHPTPRPMAPQDGDAELV